MHRRLTMACLPLLAAAALAGTRPAPAAQPAAHAVEVAVALAAPTSAPLSTAPVAQAGAVRLSAAQMGEVSGGGWFTKFWKRYGKVIIKIAQAIWDWYKTAYPTSVVSTTTYSASLSQDVTETYETEDVTENNYATQSAYNAGTVQSTSAYDTGWELTDVSYGGAGHGVEYMDAM
ncbi:MAG: hypothetical protein JWM27_2812 [Gemmatimonadetes bacterium]|nr:hypothetical protein [Gemmatimonadota bacterium]